MKLKKRVLVPVAVLLLSVALVSAATTAVFSIKAGSCEQALGAMDEIRENPFMIFFKIAVFHFNRGEYDAAAESFKKAISLKCDFQEAYHNLGVVYYRQGKDAAALAEFDKAIRIDPGYAQAYYSAGLLHFENGDFSESTRYLRRSVELDPLDANRTFDLAVSLVEQFREEPDVALLDEGIGAYRKVLELDDGFPHAKENLAFIEELRGRIIANLVDH